MLNWYITGIKPDFSFDTYMMFNFLFTEMSFGEHIPYGDG